LSSDLRWWDPPAASRSSPGEGRRCPCRRATASARRPGVAPSEWRQPQSCEGLGSSD